MITQNLLHDTSIPKARKEKAKRTFRKLTRLFSLLEQTVFFNPTTNQDGLRLAITGDGSFRESMRALRRQEECNRLIKEQLTQ
ncbi:MAG: hypothetical protein J6J38_05595 [Lachnospiraceae bacterium]|nr:hypothetical protein [Lachnospiraceae bacterium]